MTRRIKLDLTVAEARGVEDALDADIVLRMEAARDEFGQRIPGEDIDAVVPAQKRALRKVEEALRRG